jgi:thiol:disulfide interchange protein DsbD
MRPNKIIASILWVFLLCTPLYAFGVPEVGFTLTFFGYLGGLFLAGIGTSFTPCVYPLVTVTVGIFGAKKASTRLQAFSLSLAYVLGMQLTFILMGVIFSLAGNALGSQFSNPYVNLGLAILFAAMALSYFGLYELDLPEALKNRLSSVGGKGYASAFGMGAVGGIIATPCTGPAIGSLAALVTQSQDMTLGILGFSAFGFGLGLLFLVVGTFSSVALPKSGNWLDSVKSFLGIAILVLAVYYAQYAIPILKVHTKETWVLVIGLGVMFAGLALGAVHLSTYGQSAAIKLRKAVAIVIATAGAYLIVGWIDYVPPSNIKFQQGDLGKAITNAKQQKKPIFVDFGAEWCKACKSIEANVFPDAEVSKEAGRFIAVRIDCTAQDEGECAALEKEYSIPGLPRVLFFGSDGNYREDIVVQGELSPAEFLEKMKSVQ